MERSLPFLRHYYDTLTDYFKEHNVNCIDTIMTLSFLYSKEYNKQIIIIGEYHAFNVKNFHKLSTCLIPQIITDGMIKTATYMNEVYNEKTDILFEERYKKNE